MKLIKLSYDHYVVMDSRVEIASTKLTDGVKQLDLFEVRDLLSSISKIPEDLKNVISLPDLDLINETVRVYTLGYMRAEEINKDKKYTDEDLFEILLDFVEFYSPHDESRGIKIKRFMDTVQPRLSWNVEFVDGKLKLK